MSGSQQSLTSRTVVGLLWQLAGTGSESVLKIVVLIALARLLSPVEFGLVGAATVVLSFTQILSQLGVGPAVVQREHLTDEHVRTATAFTILSGCALGALVWLLSPLIAMGFKMPELAPIVASMAICFPLTAVSVVAEALLSRGMKFRILGLADVLSYGLGYGLVGITLAVMGWGAMALVAAQIGQAALRSCIILALSRHKLQLRIKTPELRQLLGFGVGYSTAEFGNFCATQADKMLVGRLLGAEALGLYGRTYQFLMLPANLIGKVGDKVLFPALASVQSEPERLIRGFSRAVFGTTLVTLPLSILLVILTPEVVRITLGDEWSEIIPPFQIFAAGLLFRTSYKTSEAVARAMGAVYARAWRQWIYAAAVCVGVFIGSHWGLVGVTTGVTLAIALNFLLMLQLSLRLLGGRWLSMVKLHLSHVLGCAPMAIVSLFTARFCREHHWPDLFTAGATGVAGGFTLLVTFVVLNRIYGQDGAWLLNVATSRLRSLARRRAAVAP